MSKNLRESFVFYRSFHESLKSELIDDASFRRLVTSICEFALDGNDFEPTNEIERLIWTPIRPQLEASRSRYEKGKKDGLKGGRPGTIDRDIVLKMSQKGYTQGYIADKLGCSRKQVNRILAEVSRVGHKTKPNVNVNDNENKNGMSHVPYVPTDNNVTKLDEVLKEEMRNKLR